MLIDGMSSAAELIDCQCNRQTQTQTDRDTSRERESECECVCVCVLGCHRHPKRALQGSAVASSMGASTTNHPHTALHASTNTLV